MRIVVGRPPNYDFIVRAFPDVKHRQGVLFTYGDTIFNPDGVRIIKSLHIHEGVHSRRQLEYKLKKSEMIPLLMSLSSLITDDIKTSPIELRVSEWWLRYIVDPLFRLKEELLAHQAEYKSESSYGRENRRAALKIIAKRLSCKMYGSMVSYEKARELIKGT